MSIFNVINMFYFHYLVHNCLWIFCSTDYTMKHQDSTMTQHNPGNRELAQRDITEEQKQLDDVINNLLSDNMMLSDQGLDPAKGLLQEQTILCKVLGLGWEKVGGNGASSDL